MAMLLLMVLALAGAISGSVSGAFWGGADGVFVGATTGTLLGAFVWVLTGSFMRVLHENRLNRYFQADGLSAGHDQADSDTFHQARLPKHRVAKNQLNRDSADDLL